ncbi:hypothetical protein D3C71_717050 [compost metagenome]
MFDQYTLGFTRRARGVNHIGKVCIGPRGLTGFMKVLQRANVCAEQFVHVDDIWRTDRQHGAPQAVGQYRLGPRIAKNVFDPRLRVGRVERHIGCPGLQDPQDRRQHPGRAAVADADESIRPHAELGQAEGDAARLRVQRPVRDGLVSTGDRDRIRRPRDLFFEELVQAYAAAQWRCRAAPVAKQFFSFNGGRESVGADREVVFQSQLAQQSVQPIEDRGGFTLVEIVGAVVKMKCNCLCIAVVTYHEGQWRLFVVVREVFRLNRAPVNAQLEVQLLVVEGKLVKLPIPRRVFLAQGPYQVAHRKTAVTMVPPLPQRDITQQFTKTGIAWQVEARGAHIDQRTDGRLLVSRAPIVDG